ncbi:MAG: hypothetical protein DWQ01_20520 [Planctomycetota bacterium]|nr:MAG: hypothetical protein DWQ01_20520 [Planctomycetota bacterium]
MIRFRRLFFHDMGRKALALVLAGVVWHQVNQGITEEQVFELTVESAALDAPHEGGKLSIRLPSHWLLADSGPGQLSFRFKGPRVQLERFLATNPSATFTPFLPQPGEGQDELLLLHNLTPLDLEWNPSQQARVFLEAAEEANRNWLQDGLRLELKSETEIPLRSWMVQVEGPGPPESHRAVVEEMSFGVDQVRITGPISAVRELEDLLMAVQQGGSGAMTLTPSLLEALAIPENRRTTLSLALGLNPEWGRRGLTMTPATVSVTLPLRNRSPQSFTWLPDGSKLLVIGAAESVWELNSPWNPPSITTTLEDLPGLSITRFDQQWGLDNIVFFVDLTSVRNDTQEEHPKVTVQWMLSDENLGDEEKALRYRALKLIPSAGNEEEFRTITLRRKPQQNP